MSTTASAPLEDRTLGDLVAERPARARVFERLGLDYCCHGNRTMAEAAVARRLDPSIVAEQLTAVTDCRGSDVDALEPVALVDHILETHHAFLHQALPLLSFGSLSDPVRMMILDRAGELLNELRAATGANMPPDDACTSYRLLYDRPAALEADIHRHVHLENNVLFPAVDGTR